MTEVQGIPDEDAAPSAHLNYQSTFTLAPQSGATGTWSFNATLLPHPVNFLFVQKTDSSGTQVQNFMNTQLPAVSHFAKMGAFWGNAQRYRMTYCSVTVYQDGPDLANQGTLAVCQAPLQSCVYNPAYVNSGGRCVAMPHVEQFSDGDRPLFDVAQSMPNAYFNNSKFGAYVPLKLTRTHQQWLSTSDAVTQAQTTAPIDQPFDGYVLPTGAAYGVFPHVNLSPAFYNSGSGGGEATSPLMNGISAHICARNLAVATSYTFFVRMGIEIQCQPGSLYTTHLRLSPAPDHEAVDNYFRIARELKDAYPADYNDLGKIWDVISSIAKTVGPALGAFGPVGSAIGMGVSGAAAVGDRIRQAIAQRSQRAMETAGGSASVGSAGDKALARQIVDAAGEQPLRRRKKAARRIAKRK